MSASTALDQRQGRPSWPRLVRAVATFLVVILVGPLIGGYTTIGGAMVIGALFSGEGGGVIGTLVLTGQMIVMVGMFSYLFGLAPAALAGVLFALMIYLGRPVGYGLAVGVGVFAALAFAGFIYSDQPVQRLGELLSGSLFLVVPAAISSVLCLWLCRRLGLVARPA